MKEVSSIVAEIWKKYEVEKIDSDYFLKAIELLNKEYPKKDYIYSRHFQKLGDKTFMHVRITFKDY